MGHDDDVPRVLCVLASDEDVLARMVLIPGHGIVTEWPAKDALGVQTWVKADQRGAYTSVALALAVALGEAVATEHGPIRVESMVQDVRPAPRWPEAGPASVGRLAEALGITDRQASVLALHAWEHGLRLREEWLPGVGDTLVGTVPDDLVDLLCRMKGDEAPDAQDETWWATVVLLERVLESVASWSDVAEARRERDQMGRDLADAQDAARAAPDERAVLPPPGSRFRLGFAFGVRNPNVRLANDEEDPDAG